MISPRRAQRGRATLSGRLYATALFAVLVLSTSFVAGAVSESGPLLVMTFGYAVLVCAYLLLPRPAHAAPPQGVLSQESRSLRILAGVAVAFVPFMVVLLLALI